MSVVVERAAAVELIARPLRWMEQTAADGEPRRGWSRALDSALVLGSAQRPEAFGTRPGMHLLRRGTGGGAVICDATYLMLDVVLPRHDPRVLDDLAESYRWLAAELLAHLPSGPRALTPGEVGGDDRRLGGIACWAGFGPHEIVTADGRKLFGLAQRRRAGAALFQAAAYLEQPGDGFVDLLPAAEDERGEIRARLARVAALGAVAPDFAPW